MGAAAVATAAEAAATGAEAAAATGAEAVATAAGRGCVRELAQSIVCAIAMCGGAPPAHSVCRAARVPCHMAPHLGRCGASSQTQRCTPARAQRLATACSRGHGAPHVGARSHAPLAAWARRRDPGGHQHRHRHRHWDWHSYRDRERLCCAVHHAGMAGPWAALASWPDEDTRAIRSAGPIDVRLRCGRFAALLVASGVSSGNWSGPRPMVTRVTLQ